jgi:hypothetical protein
MSPLSSLSVPAATGFFVVGVLAAVSNPELWAFVAARAAQFAAAAAFVSFAPEALG